MEQLQKMKANVVQISVLQDTADRLSELAGQSGMSIGEVIDRQTLKLIPSGVDAAHLLAMEHFMISVSGLTVEEQDEAYMKITASLLAALPEEKIDRLLYMAEDMRRKILDKEQENGPASAENTPSRAVVPSITSVRKMDELGRIMLTGAARELLHIGEGDAVKISADQEKGIILVCKADESEAADGVDPFVRKADQLGRIVLPLEIRAQLGIQERDRLEIAASPEKNQVTMRKAVNRCLKCGNSESLAEIHPGFYLCVSCIETISANR